MILRLAFGAVPFNLLKLTLAANVSSPEFSSKSSSSLSRPGSLLGVCPFVFFSSGACGSPPLAPTELARAAHPSGAWWIVGCFEGFHTNPCGDCQHWNWHSLQTETSFEVRVVAMVLREVSVFARSVSGRKVLRKLCSSVKRRKLRISSVCQTVFRSAL